MKKITCDYCQRELEQDLAPLILTITIHQISNESHYCSYDCMKTYLLNKLKGNEEDDPWDSRNIVESHSDEKEDDVRFY